MDALAGREVIFEFRSAGGSVQVCAVDCETAIEVFVTTPANTMRVDQQTLALRKLAKALVDHGVIPPLPGTQENSGNPSKVPLSSKRGFWA
jgi:hypothetical protein